MRSTTTILAAAMLALSTPAIAQQTMRTELVTSGLSSPLLVTAPQNDLGRIFIVEQRSGTTGRIRVKPISGGTATIYLSVPAVATGGEQGLLGLAFHPDFLTNGYFYVNYTATPQAGISAGSTIVARYRANAPYATSLTADAASATILMTIRQPDANHNGGWMSFGPDGLLYIATGDGGCGNDNNCAAPNPPSVNPPGHTPGTGNAQDVTANLLGKILRIDIDGADNIPGNDDDDGVIGGSGPTPYTNPGGNPFDGTTGDREIFIYGLRNPWRNSFDRQTGDLWIADVGQGQREEINFIPAGSGSGWNMGWRCMEGTRCTGLAGCTCNAASLVRPVLEYPHSGTLPPTTLNGCSITGGYVYRGSAIPCLRGTYFFTDYCTPQIWSFRLVNNQISEVTNRTAELAAPAGTTIDNIVSFGEDASGELYIVDQTGGQVFKIVLNTTSGPDCNTNSVPDACDIAQGTSTDANTNGIPDECECDPDTNCDGVPDQDDVACIILAVAGDLSCFCQTDPDFNGDGVPDQGDVADVILVVAGAPCP